MVKVLSMAGSKISLSMKVFCPVDASFVIVNVLYTCNVFVKSSSNTDQTKINLNPMGHKFKQDFFNFWLINSHW